MSDLRNAIQKRAASVTGALRWRRHPDGWETEPRRWFCDRAMRGQFNLYRYNPGKGDGSLHRPVFAEQYDWEMIATGALWEMKEYAAELDAEEGE